MTDRSTGQMTQGTTGWVSQNFLACWPATIGRPSGDYGYIDILMKDINGGGDERVRLIMDMDFRSQFELARPTSTYSELTVSLQSIFVRSEEKLMEIMFGLLSK
ncbi:hypothetical protein LOK49_LG04G01912 [Camellia lanceoleosa]|uniref:Uncharacterized protein n=1 Tax=Camellia lanceoleosa TaxID=1840588 RepID=A0ACC0I1Y8_9ERIC|nr:hypothetical protein LOK49_LG04G01912 [Camellia lanceoleosa]